MFCALCIVQWTVSTPFLKMSHVGVFVSCYELRAFTYSLNSAIEIGANVWDLASSGCMMHFMYVLYDIGACC